MQLVTIIRSTGFFCLLLALCVSHVAVSRADDRGQALVHDFLDNVHTLSAGFSQTLIDAAGITLEESTGELSISRPGKFRWSYETPYEQLLVADGLNIWSYDADLAQVTVKPQSRALANTPALLLGGSAEVLEDFEFGGSREEGGLTWVRMRPIDTDSGFRLVELGFVDGNLSQMVFFDNLEQTTVVSLDDVVVNAVIDASHYEFSIPDDVDVVGTPLARDAQEG